MCNLTQFILLNRHFNRKKVPRQCKLKTLATFLSQLKVKSVICFTSNMEVTLGDEAKVTGPAFLFQPAVYC